MGGRGSTSGTGTAPAQGAAQAKEQAALPTEPEQSPKEKIQQAVEEKGLIFEKKYHPSRGDYVTLIVERPRGKWYVAQITGEDQQYGFKRQFLPREQPYVIQKDGFYEVQKTEGERIYFAYARGQVMMMENKEQAEQAIKQYGPRFEKVR